MPFMIMTTDKPGAGPLREKLRAEHIAYLKSKLDLLLAGGALLDDAGQAASGGLLIVDTDDRAVAEQFIAEDPFTKGGLFSSTVVTRWRKGFFDGKALL
jgi:uncharacterized protein YciI